MSTFQLFSGCSDVKLTPCDFFLSQYELTDRKNHNITEENGFWRSHGVGPVAMTKQTYLRSSGYNQNIHGWGNEDTELYDDFIKNGIQFVRSHDEGVFHPWHSKECSG
jgi:chondroitin sulfate synthase